MKLKTLSLLGFCGVLSFGCAHNANKSSANHSPKNRYVASASGEISKLYFELAGALSKARRENHACESGVYEENVLEALERSKEFDFDNNNFQNLVKANPEHAKEIKDQIGHTLSYKVVMSDIPYYQSVQDIESTSKVRSLIEGTKFSAPGQGAYGSTMNLSFKQGGVVEKNQLTNIDSWPFVWEKSIGKWKLNGYSKKYHGNIVSVTTEILSGPNKGKSKTKAYLIKKTCEYGSCMYGLLPINKVDKKGYSTTPFYDYEAFDMNVNECDA